MSITQPPRQAHLDKLRTELQRLERARQNMRVALSQYNDIEAQKHFAPVIDLLGVILENEKQGIAHFLASDLENIASALRRFELPDDDPVLEAETPSLAAMIAARGRVSDRLAGCLQELKHLRLPALNVDAPYAPVPRNVLGEALIRLDERLRITEESVDALRAEAREADAAGAPVNQSGLINVHVSSLKVEVSAARFEASIAELVDMAALARAGEIIRDIGNDLAAFASATYSRLAAAVAAAGRSTARLAGRAAKGIRTVISLARRKVAGRRKLLQVTASEPENVAPEVPEAVDASALHEEFWRLIRVGAEAVRLGGLDNANGAFLRAHDIAQQVLGQRPDDLTWQRNLSVSYNRIGDVRQAQGDLAAALNSYEAGLAIAEALSQGDPRNTVWQRDLSVSHFNIGDVRQAQGDLAGALESYKAGHAIREVLSQRDPHNMEWQRDLSVSHNKIGNLRQAQGDLAGALKSYEAGLAIREVLSQRDPRNTQWQRDLAVSYTNIGDIRRAQGDLAGALKSFEAGLAIAEALSQGDPRNTVWQRDLSISHFNIGDVRQAQGDLAGALESYEAGLAIRDVLSQRDPRNTQWQRDLSISHNKIGNVRQAQGDLAGALKSYEADLAIAERLAALDPQNAMWRNDVAISRRNVTRVKAMIAARK